MQQICAEAKMSPGALYRYFPSKEAIIEAIAEDERRRAKGVMALFQEPGSLLDRLMRAVAAYLDMVREPGGGALMFEVFSESIRNSQVGAQFDRIECDVREEFVAMIEKAKASGEVPAIIDVEATVSMLMAFGDGLAMRVTVDPTTDVERLQPVLRRAFAGLLGLPAEPG